ncbi:MAG: Uma2 family endonuclease [Caldilineaceae bacterium]|nr:Uma2 family endonuclease [Caldilineaceae bacterium]MBP8106101.1 Uma2 family endonuclease [Caldilineaceae bacterium]MBP8123880.1 Uma2 family endonuclease [Caldilineaceae bacterium]MBP9073950.1 Uma2 family endonuclease [Caldilineaceae bacterium]
MSVMNPTRVQDYSESDQGRKHRSRQVAGRGDPTEAAILALTPGDRLTRYEFERRYDAMPDLKKAELIEGVVYMPSPVRYDVHGQPHAQIMGWLFVYSTATPGTGIGDNTSVRLDLENEPQPDALLRLERGAGGASTIGADGYVAGPPELIVEIAASSASYDLHDKLRVYQRHGVQEYGVWRIYEGQIDWLSLHQGRYEPLPADEAGVVRSLVFPGLWLDVPALLAGELAQVLATLQAGLASPQHAAFVQAVQAKLAAAD